MKNLIFDAGGVLVWPRLGQWNLPFRAAEILGPERAADLTTDRFNHARDRLLYWLDESRLVTDLEHERLLRRGFVLELNRAMGWHMSDAEITALTDDFTDNINRYGFFDDLVPWLTRWSKQYRLAVLSDAMPSIILFLEQYGIAPLFSEIVISTHVGATKPDPRMYAEVLRRLNADPADCLFVDDRACNVEGAVRCGLRAVQMSRPEFPADPLWDGPVARSFSELNTYLP